MNFFTHLGRYLLMIKGMFARPENMRLYWKELMHQCNEIGVRSLGIVIIISIFLGAVTTVQTAYQLVTPLIPKSIIAVIVRDNIILELAPTLICVVLAGVVGSRIASELGNMRISEQIDALEIMGINTKTYLILPKIIAALIVVPCLVIIFCRSRIRHCRRRLIRRCRLAWLGPAHAVAQRLEAALGEAKHFGHDPNPQADEG